MCMSVDICMHTSTHTHTQNLELIPTIGMILYEYLEEPKFLCNNSLLLRLSLYDN